MIWAVLGMIMVAEAAKLNNAYLPPPAAKEAGGSDGALQVPLEPPYIDRYTPEPEPQQPWRPGTRSLARAKPKAIADKIDQQQIDAAEEEDKQIEQSRFISGSYSYTGPDNVLVTVTYTADTNKARKIDNKVTEDQVEEEEYEDEDVVDSEEEGRQIVGAEEDEETVAEDEDIVPTPPTLPAALARAFNFHRRKYEEHQQALEKTYRPKKPLRENINKRKGQKKPQVAGQEQENKHHSGTNQQGAQHSGTHQQGAHHSGTHQQGPQYAGQYGMRIPGHHQSQSPKDQSGYQYPNQGDNQLYDTPIVHQGYSYPKA